MGSAVYDELFRSVLGLVEKDVVPDRAIRACLLTLARRPVLVFFSSL